MNILVEYIDHMGDDITVVNSARVSFDKTSQITEEGLRKGDVKLINFLAKNNHFTPFTHPQITLRETVPIFVARQRFKHTVGFTYNEISRRYVDNPPEFYIPKEWRSRPDLSIKQGSGAVLEDGEDIEEQYREYIEHSKSLYNSLLKRDVAPEQARMILPQSMLTSYYVTGSLAAYARLVNQRSDSHAQKEIQDLAEDINKIMIKLYPVSWAALTQGEY